MRPGRRGWVCEGGGWHFERFFIVVLLDILGPYLVFLNFVSESDIRFGLSRLFSLVSTATLRRLLWVFKPF